MQHLQKIGGGRPQCRSVFAPSNLWQHTSEGRYQPDRNQEVSVLPSDHFKLAEILLASAARASHRIASGKFRDFWRKIPRLKPNFRSRPPYPHRKPSTLAWFQWRRVG